MAAPGAVGKSTLARQIAAATSSIYLDLAVADTVAGNYLTGGLAKNGLYAEWRSGETNVLIDALDEARLRVTQSSFEDFLLDVAAISKPRRLPTILFGRVGIVDEAWLALADRGLECPIFDVDFFDSERSRQFVLLALRRLSRQNGFAGLEQRLDSHHSVYESAASDFVSGLENVAKADGSRFAGYAPVLEAAATVLAGIGNPATLTRTVQEAVQDQVLRRLSDHILDREAGKLRAQLQGLPDGIRSNLYGPDEQLGRLASTVLKMKPPPSPPGLSAEEVSAYELAVEGLIAQHPFLDGAGTGPSGHVFGAVITSHALLRSDAATAAAAAKRAGEGPGTPNPFLIDFYLSKAGPNPTVPPEHLALLFDSVRARSAAGDVVRLTVEADDEDERADCEILVNQTDHRSPTVHEFATSQAGSIRFGRQVSGVSIDAPLLDAVIGSGNPVELIAPVNMRVARLSFECPEIVVQQGERDLADDDNSVLLEASELARSQVAGVPIVRKGSTLAVSWPDSSQYPWTSFSVAQESHASTTLDTALRSLRRLVMAFRSHSKGRLARYRHKIEHARMTKGATGIAVREKLVRDGVLTLDGKMYFLDADLLGRVVGATYQDLKMKRFNDQVRRYLTELAD